MLDRWTAEVCVSLATSATLGAALWRGAALHDFSDGSRAWAPLAAVLSLLLLTLAAIFAELKAGSSLGKLYRQRAAASSGLALGALALPWAFAGLAVKQRASEGGLRSGNFEAPPGAATLHTCLAASAAALLFLLRRARPVASLSAAQPRPPKGRRPQQPPARQQTWVLEAALWAVLLLAAATEAGCSLWHGAALLGTATAAIACLGGLLSALPATFTVGEALVAAEAAALLGRAALEQVLPPPRAGAATGVGDGALGGAQAASQFQLYVLLLTTGSTLAAALLLPLLLRAQRQRHAAQPGATAQQAGQQAAQQNGSARSKQPGLSAAAAAALAAAVAAAAALAPAALWALRYALSSRRRCLLCLWWAGDLAAALPIMGWLSGSGRVPSILVRKGYHLLAVSLFLPALLTEPQLLGVALSAAYVVLLVVEAARISGLPGIAHRIHLFMTSFVDARDSGALLITHFTLLLGMAAPVWLSNTLREGVTGAAVLVTDGAAAGAEQQQQQQQAVWLPAYAGIVILGFGDTAASAVGSQLGRLPICRGSKKTVEGTAAAVACTLAAWWLLESAVPAVTGQGASSALGLGLASWPGLAAATALSCLLEAVTTQLDNVFMPLHYFALLCLL